MANFDFHRRRLQANLWLVGSHPASSRALLNRWAACAGARARLDPACLKLPPVPMAEEAGFDVEVQVEHERGVSLQQKAPDACVLVIGRGASRLRVLEVLKRRARDSACRGPIIWAAEEGWSQALGAAARQIGAGDDLLRHPVRGLPGALACLEVALACLIEDLLTRVHPAVPAEWAPEAAIVSQRLRYWTRVLHEGRGGETAAPASGACEHRGEAAVDAPWRRKALELEHIEPLAAAEAVWEIEQLDRIVTFSSPLLGRRGPGKDAVEDKPHLAKGLRRR